MFKKLWLLVIILIIASFLRLHNFTELPPGLYPDEAMNGNNAVEAWENRDWKVFYPENHGREGLFINIQSLFIAAFGNEPWVLRLPSAIFGILTVWGLYLFTKELFADKKMALLASFLLATSFWHINFSRIGFRAIMAPFFLIWALYFLLLSYKSYKSYWSYFLSILAGLTYGLGFHSYIAYRVTPLLIIFIVYFYFKNYSNVLKNIRIVFLFFAIAAIVTIAPFGIYFYNHPQDFLGRTSSISIFNSETPVRDLGLNILKTTGMFNVFGDFNWRHNVAGRPLLFWPVGIFFLVGIISGAKSILRKSDLPNIENNNSRRSDFPKLPFVILFIWLFIALIPVVVSNEGLPHALRSLLAVPPVFILAAIGGLKIYEFLKPKLSSCLLSVVVYVFCSLLLFESYVTYFITWGQNSNVKPAFAYNDSIIAQYLNSLPKETPKYIVVSDVKDKIERDNPISLQTILFLTDTFTDKKRKEKNIYYISSEKLEEVPGGAKIIYL
ncbi:MAG: glycosyltransferase family 39 protein [Candidatus Harrisonbacteria bacterium]|nr:glycosyltransferase family 39 protein [Candidatus Harrisonbacteria bacterium]